MSLSNKQLDSLHEDDLQDLIDNKFSERKIIEYKQSLPNNSHKHKREFLADVSSFANAAGGHLIYGIREESGIPVEASGLQNIDADAEILRFENIIRDGIEPRISGVQMQAIPLKTSGVAIIIRIPRSWALPHVAKYEKHWRFYSRNSAGKYPLDVGELRAAFALSETTSERIRNFRTERLSKIVAGETPIAMGEDSKIVLHIIPFSAFDPASKFDVSALGSDLLILKPLAGLSFDYRYNFDGLLTYSKSRQATFAHAYLQIFRNGIIEGINIDLFHSEGDRRIIPITLFEKELTDALRRFLLIQKKLSIEPPFLVMLSLLGVSGYTISANLRGPMLNYVHPHPIDRDNLLVPESIVESFENSPFEVMRPIFDAIWNAAGWPCSGNYDETGKWIGRL